MLNWLCYHIVSLHSLWICAGSEDGEISHDVNSPWIKLHKALRIGEDVDICVIADLSGEDSEGRKWHGVELLREEAPYFCFDRGGKILGVKDERTQITSREKARRDFPAPFNHEGFKGEKKTVKNHPLTSTFPPNFRARIILSINLILFFDHAHSH